MAKAADERDPLDAALAAIKQQYGAGTAYVFKDAPRQDVAVIDSGSIGLNRALGVGGFPRGRIVEAYGPESSGKTSIALHAAATVQRDGGRVAFIDAEHSLDPAWCRRLGVDPDLLIVSQPDFGEQGLNVADTLVQHAGAVDLIIIDSVAALVPEAELKGEIGDQHMGLQARMMSQALRKLTGAASKSKTTVIFINQLREKVGVMFGSPETTPGGKALKFYASMRLDVRRIETLKEAGEAYGNKIRIKVVKNKVGPPHRQVELDFLYERGLAADMEAIDEGVAARIITKAGAFYSYNGDRLGQGKSAAGRYLRSHPELMTEITSKIVAADQQVAPLAEPVADGAGDDDGDPFGPESEPRA